MDSAYPTTSYYNGAGGPDGWAPAGYVQASWSDDGRAHTKRSIFQMSISPVLGKVVSAAHFNVNNVYSSSCQARAVSMYLLSAPPGPSTTWNNQPSTLGGAVDTRTFAHGYNSSCPAATEAFNALGAVQTGQSAGSSSITLMLAAQNESDTYTWKKFDPNVSLTIDYDTPPDVPLISGVSGCNICSPVAYVRSGNPSVGAGANDPDGDNIQMFFDFAYGWNGAGGVFGTLQSPFLPTGSWTTVVPTLGEGDYAYRVRAQDTAGVLSGWSAWVPFTVDTSPPGAPTVSLRAASGLLSSAVESLVGDTAWTATISSTGPDHARGYIYGVTPAGVGGAPPSNMTCGTTASYYTMVCMPTVGASLSVPVGALQENSEFKAWSFDAAGNLTGGSLAGQQSLSAFASRPSPRVKLGHQWNSQGTVGDCATTAPDSTSGTAARLLTLSGGACRRNSTATWAAPLIPDIRL